MSVPQEDRAREVNPYVSPRQSGPGNKDFRPKTTGVNRDSVITHVLAAPEQESPQEVAFPADNDNGQQSIPFPPAEPAEPVVQQTEHVAVTPEPNVVQPPKAANRRAPMGRETTAPKGSTPAS